MSVRVKIEETGDGFGLVSPKVVAGRLGLRQRGNSYGSGQDKPCGSVRSRTLHAKAGPRLHDRCASEAMTLHRSLNTGSKRWANGMRANDRGSIPSPMKSLGVWLVRIDPTEPGEESIGIILAVVSQKERYEQA
ncbi:MAG: hypothetical protein ACP5MD_14605 [Verrucomicrobiia bacterium]